jgi:fructokinase
MTAMIVVAGEALIDRIVRADGTTVDRPGGGPFNTARTIARLGVPVSFLGGLSTDPFGRVLRDALVSDGVNLSFAVSTDAPTTLAVARIDAHGTARYMFETANTAASQLPAEAIRSVLASRPEALHVGTLGLVMEPIATNLAGAMDGVDPDMFVIVDLNCRPSAIHDRDAYIARLIGVAGHADVIKASRDDLEYLWPGMPTSVAAHRLLTAGPRAVVVTDARHPVVWFTPEWQIDLQVPSVPVVDTIGAGDAFGGAFLARWIERGRDRTHLLDEAAVRDALSIAIEVAGITCGRAGADPPRRDEVTWPE